MRVVEGRLTEVHVELVCDWCGAREELPAEEAARAQALRVRAAERRWAEEAVLGPPVTLLKSVEGELARRYLSGVGLLLFLVVCTQIMKTESLFAALQDPPVWLAMGLFAGSVGGFALVRRQVRFVVLPLVAAAPPASGGEPSRCRRCGAPLEFVSRGFSTCSFCKAENLASPSVVAARAKALSSEATRRRRAAHPAREQVTRVAHSVGPTLAACGAVGALVFFAMAQWLGG